MGIPISNKNQIRSVSKSEDSKSGNYPNSEFMGAIEAL